jgi:integrase
MWNGRENDPKTKKSAAPVPVIRQLADRLELHRLRQKNAQKGPLFPTSTGKAEHMNNFVNRVILPALNRCEICHRAEGECDQKTVHEYQRDPSLPEWHGWHACRRGLGSNLYRLGVPDVVIQRILRHANVSTTTGYYIKTAADDVRQAMTKLENSIPESPLDTNWTPNQPSSRPN